MAGPIKAAHDAANRKLERFEANYGHVDHKLDLYKIAKSALPETGAIGQFDIATIRGEIEQLIADREAGNRRTVRPDHLTMLDLFHATHVGPTLRALIVSEEMLSAIKVQGDKQTAATDPKAS